MRLVRGDTDFGLKGTEKVVRQSKAGIRSGVHGMGAVAVTSATQNKEDTPSTRADEGTYSREQ